MKILDYEGLTYLIEKIKGLLSKKADTTYVDSKVKTYGEVTTAENGLMIAADKVKLNSISDNANNYTHPGSHPASIITETTTKRFVTDAEKADWNAKETTEGAQDKATAALDSAKDYVDGKVLTDVPVGAKFTDTTYTHPTSHPYSMITGAPTSLPANGGDSATVNGKTVEVNVPANAKFTDTVYTHPSKHEASDITETSSKRFVSDAEKTTWNAKLETSALTPIETSISDLSDQLGDIISRLEALETVDGE